jgi:hypothetical protein
MLLSLVYEKRLHLSKEFRMADKSGTANKANRNHLQPFIFPLREDFSPD